MTLQDRVLQLSRKHKLSHLSSNLTSVDIIDEIYTTKRPDDLFVLSAGHAGLALYVALEKHEGRDAEFLYLKHRTHPSRDPKNGIHVSAGSLGSAITIALGMAMGDRARDVYCLISDGEAYEGSVYETLNAKAAHGLTNLKVYVNWNGFTGLGETHQFLKPVLAALDPDIRIRPTVHIYDLYPFLAGVKGHYINLPESWEIKP